MNRLPRGVVPSRAADRRAGDGGAGYSAATQPGRPTQSGQQTQSGRPPQSGQHTQPGQQTQPRAAPLARRGGREIRATYRLQLHAGFTFDDAAKLVPYLRDLGVSHLYASPILTARPGSMHGYDVIDPTAVNPELGGEAGLRRLVARLHDAGLGLIVDIVPNHMAVGGNDNVWWRDVLRHGPDSRYAGWFDIDWAPADPALQGKVLAPFLGAAYGEALAAGDIRLDMAADDGPVVRYYDDRYPVAPRDHAEIAAAGAAAFDPATGDGRARLHRLLERQHYRLAWWGTAGDEINWRRFFDINGLAALRMEDPAVFEATHATLFRLYGDGLIDGLRIDHVDGLTDPPGYCRRLRQRLQDLAAEADRPAATPLAGEGSGRNRAATPAPSQREGESVAVSPAPAAAGQAYIVVEKILGAGESLPTDWGVDGTSGYDFMDVVSAVQHDPEAERILAFFWSSVSGRPADFATEEVLARLQVLERGFDAQLEATATLLHRLARLDPVTRDTTQPAIRRGLLALLAHFPVYRTYNAGVPRTPGGQRAFAQALAAAKATAPLHLHPVLDRIDRWLGGEEAGKPGAHLRTLATRRFQQLSAPVAAKAVEDTAFYRYGRLLSRNDVGFDARLLGCEAPAFHAANAERGRDFPRALLATATHDHKRGEDVRARLAVLSELPAEWQAAVQRWLELNAPLRPAAGPTPGDEAMLYQMIVGAWPMMLAADDAPGLQDFAERLAGWQQKAIREAKLQGDWTGPDEAYESAVHDFLRRLLAPAGSFATDAALFVQRIAAAGAVNSLAQTLLKMTAPGVPDFFQGIEFWDLSLVDPDNRRPVDFDLRVEALRRLESLQRGDAAQRAGATQRLDATQPLDASQRADSAQREASARRADTTHQATSPVALAAEWRDGRVKQAVVAHALRVRRMASDLFLRGDYLPLEAVGPMARHVVAFARVLDGEAVLTVVPRLPVALLAAADSIVLSQQAWRGTVLRCPPQMAGRRLHDGLGSSPALVPGHDIAVASLLEGFPIGLRTTIEAPSQPRR